MNEDLWVDEMLRLIKLIGMIEATLPGKTREYLKRKIDKSLDIITSDRQTDINLVIEYLAMFGIVLPDTSPVIRIKHVIPLP